MMFRWFLLLFIGLYTSVYGQHPGHAHNDYEHPQPLWDALEHEFRSIEVDLYLQKENQLKVAHLPVFLGSKPDFKDLYVMPLLHLLEKDSTRWSHEAPLVIMVDLKGDDKSKLVGVLHAELRPLFKFIQRVGKEEEDKSIERGVIQLVLSGGPPRTALPFYKEDIFFIDGNISDLDQKWNPRIARISTNFKDHFEWNGSGKIPGIEKIKMQEMAAKAEKLGYSLRFWNAPDQENFWKVALEAGVDWINTDDLDGFQSFYNRFND